VLRRALPAALLFAALPASAAPNAAVAPRGGPGSARALRASLAELDGRVTALLAKARTNPDLERVATYAGYGPAQLGDPKRGVSATDLLEVLENPAAVPQARENAAEALVALKALTNDPDLSTEGKGVRRTRAAFSMKLTRVLTEGDLLARSLANRVLQGFWPGMPDPDAIAYDARRKNTWREGRQAWEKFLRK
jgi:hypothetical protein